MIPGPSEPEAEVLSVLSLPIMPHYGEKWGAFYKETTSKFQKIFRTKNEVILVPIPGQLAVEMSVANLVMKGQEAFVCTNGGLFPDMISTMIEFWGGKPVPIRAKSLNTAVTASEVKEALDSSKDPAGKALFVVHNETSTGVVNPAAEIFKVAHERGVLTVLDAISGFGGIDVRVDEWHADYAIGYASKALGGVFGANPVAISQDVWDSVNKNKDKIHTRYLNLNVWRHYIDEWGAWGHPHPSSMPTSIIVGLSKAADIVLREGLDERYRRHDEVAKFTRDGLKKLGLEIYPDPKYVSSTVSVPKTDPKWNSELRKQLVSRFDIMIGGGLGELEGKIVRIGHMGTSATYPKVALTLEAIGSILEDVRKR
jgi:aspartate aminotransferase-like enzyme